MRLKYSILFSPGKISKDMFSRFYRENLAHVTLTNDIEMLLKLNGDSRPDFVVLDAEWFVTFYDGALKSWVKKIEVAYPNRGVDIVVVGNCDSDLVKDQLKGTRAVFVYHEKAKELAIAVTQAIGQMK